MEIVDKRGVLSPIWQFQNQNAVFKLFIVPYSNVMPWSGEGVPGDV